MATRTEWLDARDARVNYGPFEDANGNREEHAIIIGNDDNIAIHGTDDELRDLATRINHAIGI